MFYNLPLSEFLVPGLSVMESAFLATEMAPHLLYFPMTGLISLRESCYYMQNIIFTFLTGNSILVSPFSLASIDFLFVLQTEDYLKRKIRSRPERSELVRMHILEGRTLMFISPCTLHRAVAPKLWLLRVLAEPWSLDTFSSLHCLPLWPTGSGS